MLSAALALVAIGLSQLGWLQTNAISALTLAIVLGMAVGNSLPRRALVIAESGITCSKQTILRLGIILYGCRLTFQDVAQVGAVGVAIDALVLTSTFLLAWWAGPRLFGLDRTTAMLIGVGSSICGAAAIMATAPVVRGRAAQATVAVSTVVVFGSLAIFIYPALYHLNSRHSVLAVWPAAYGIFAGSTIHEVAQVVAAGRAVSDAAANTAVITKMVRVMMLAPFLVILSAFLPRCNATVCDSTNAGGITIRDIVIPWFALGFIAMTAINSAHFVPRVIVDLGVRLDSFVLALAMSALGVGTRIAAIRDAGTKPVAFAALLFGWLIVGGSAINAALTIWF